MKLRFLAIAALATLSLTACLQQADDASTTSPSLGDGSLTAAGLAGSFAACGTFPNNVGNVYSGRTYSRGLTHNSNGTYVYTLNLYNDSQTTCLTNKIVNGTNNTVGYQQTGTFAVNGIATSPATGTKITYTPLSQSLTMHATGDSGATATWFNTCSGTPGFATSGDSSRNMSGNICNGNGSYALGDFPVNGAAVYNVVAKPGNLSVGSRFNVWNPGMYTAGSVSTSFSDTYYP